VVFNEWRADGREKEKADFSDGQNLLLLRL
jgi:hypothetical protein